MCYLDTYTCSVQCLNSNLNMTSAMNGTIESIRSIGTGCHVTACELVSHASEGSYVGAINIFNLWRLLLIPIAVLIVATLWYTYWGHL